MEQLIFWFNILGFTLLFASMGAAYVVYGRLKPSWLFFYLVYLSVYAFFTIFNTYEFFGQVYLPPAAPFLDYLTMYLTFFIALFLLIAVPGFIFSLFPDKQKQKQKQRQKVLTFVMAGIFLAMVIIAILYPEWKLDRAGSVFLNGYLGTITLYGLIRIRRVKNRDYYGVVIPFLYLSCFFLLYRGLTVNISFYGNNAPAGASHNSFYGRADMFLMGSDYFDVSDS